MLFRVEHIPHRSRSISGKCRGCKRHSTYKIRLHKLKAYLKVCKDSNGKTIKDKDGSPKIDKEFRPIGNQPLLLCSRRCITLAQLAFL